MSHTNKIFDRVLISQRRQHALAQENYPDFLDVLIAQEMVSRLELIERKFENCLVLGKPSPSFVKEISQSPKIASAMYQMGQSGDLVYDEEWLPFKDNSLDCIIAPPGLELVNDLPGLLLQANRALKPDGLFLAAMYGGLTLAELRHAWLLADEEVFGGASPRVAPFIDVRQAGNLLQRAGLALPVADTDILTIRYKDVAALMNEIRAMGLANPLLQRIRKFSNRRLLERVDKIYAGEFSDPDSRVRATVEIIYLTGWSPDESQQKPLKPGTASKPFSEILNPGKTSG